MSTEQNSRHALLKFDPDLNRLDDEGKELRDGLSAAVLDGDTLWLACDETTRLERLTRDRGEVFHAHARFPLSVPLDLQAPETKEADIEGLDIADGFLWLVGSHSLKRTRPAAGKTPEKNRQRLAEVTPDGNRFLLARVPLVADGGTHRPEETAGEGDGKRVAARLRGDAKGSDLTAALKKGEHLGRFFGNAGDDNSGIPGKDKSSAGWTGRGRRRRASCSPTASWSGSWRCRSAGAPTTRKASPSCPRAGAGAARCW